MGKAKDIANLRKRGISFEDILTIFDEAVDDGLLLEDRRRDYDEQRFVLLRPFMGKVYHVPFTRRGGAIRLISARRANWKEVRDYESVANREGSHRA